MLHLALDVLWWTFLIWGSVCMVAVLLIGVLTLGALVMGSRCEKIEQDDEDRVEECRRMAEDLYA